MAVKQLVMTSCGDEDNLRCRLEQWGKTLVPPPGKPLTVWKGPASKEPNGPACISSPDWTSAVSPPSRRSGALARREGGRPAAAPSRRAAADASRTAALR